MEIIWMESQTFWQINLYTKEDEVQQYLGTGKKVFLEKTAQHSLESRASMHVNA